MPKKPPPVVPIAQYVQKPGDLSLDEIAKRINMIIEEQKKKEKQK